METELVRHAERKVNARKWRSGSFLPKGFEPADFVAVAITKTLNGILAEDDGNGIRTWNESKNPELVDHLKDAIDSEISNLRRSKEHVATNYSSDTSSEDAQNILENSIDEQTTAQHPHSRTPEHEHFEMFWDELLDELNGDKEALSVLKAYQQLSQKTEVVKPQDAAKMSGLSIEKVQNAVKRIRRAANNIRVSLQKMEEQSG